VYIKNSILDSSKNGTRPRVENHCSRKMTCSLQPDKYEEWKSKKHEPKLAYNEIPLAPDLTKPFPSWMEKVVEYRFVTVQA